MANRVAEVNRELRLRGIAERLTRGKGYYYFRDGEAAGWYSSSVYVYRAEDLPVERWLEEWSDKSGKPLPQICAWFALCENVATTTEPHPVLGEVPICERCAAKVAKLKKGS